MRGTGCSAEASAWASASAWRDGVGDGVGVGVGDGVGVGVGVLHALVLVVPVASARLDSLPAASIAVRPIV